MNSRNYQNNQYLHKPTDWGDYKDPERLKDYLKFTEIAYDQLIHDLTAPETPGCISNGRVYFGMDMAVSAPIEDVLANVTFWYQFYEVKLYGEDLTDAPKYETIEGVDGDIKRINGVMMIHTGAEWVVIGSVLNLGER